MTFVPSPTSTIQHNAVHRYQIYEYTRYSSTRRHQTIFSITSLSSTVPAELPHGRGRRARTPAVEQRPRRNSLEQSQTYLLLRLLHSLTELTLIVEPDLPMRVLDTPSEQKAFFKVGKASGLHPQNSQRAISADAFRRRQVIQTRLRRPEDGQKVTVYGIIVHVGSDESECLLVEASGHSATVRSNQSDPRGKHGIIYTTPCPPSPLVDEKKLRGAIFATKFNYFLDLPPTTRVNYKSLFMVRHDAEVFPVAKLEVDNLTALCLNYEEVTGGQKLHIEFPRPPEDPKAPPAYNSLFPKSENEVD
ncbi:uncharacterized protein J3D65DRAFT_696171 [Phyllosticta citribraziliensis]|uniref:DUF6590 domain-containing protein n=1 Tax=Phyllosticta citribraziliensis TaxID=989973 RepID=A0ABR1LQV4_9PEZI